MAVRKLSATATDLYFDLKGRRISRAEYRRQTQARDAALLARIKAERGVEHLKRVPEMVPPGRAFVHNNISPTRALGVNGFRAWLVDAGDPRHAGRVVCDCGRFPELGTHYRMPRRDAA
jgi:hypothetical protein